MTMIRKATLEFTPDDHVTFWQKRDGQRTLAVGEFEIDMPVDTARALHGEIATGLGLRCRPRSLQEQLAGHTRAALDLIADPALGDPQDAPSMQVWVLATEDDGEVLTSVHPSEQDALDALRVQASVPDDVDDSDLLTHVREDVETDLDVTIEGFVVRYPLVTD